MVIGKCIECGRKLPLGNQSTICSPICKQFHDSKTLKVTKKGMPKGIRVERL